MSAFLGITGTIIFIYGIILCMMSNLNLGVILVAVIGLFLIIWGIFYDKFKKFRFVFISLICVELVFVSVLAIYGEVDNVTYKEDAVIVLGAGIRGDKVTFPLKVRLLKAIEYHNKHPGAVIVVTGGQGLQETVTEAYAMEKFLLENGIPKEKIIKEEKATSTNENMRFSKELLDKRFSDDYEIVVITNGFHILRSVMIAKNEGFKNVSHMGATLQWYNIMPCYIRETLAILKMWVFG